MNQSNVISLYKPGEEPAASARFVSPPHPRPMWVFDSESFRHAQKMEAMGRLAAGVAHDFYNILTIIQGYTVLLGRGEGTPQEITEQLNHISAAANRGAILTRQLLAYSRRDGVQFEPLDLNGLIDNLSNMLQRLLGEDIVLQTSFCSSLAPILGDTGMVEQVLMNLVVNARDAIPNGGRISIHVDAAQISPTHVQRYPQAKVGEFACVSVCDTGIGMTKELLTRVFEPFFTTKDPDKGTGLGLAIVQSIIEQHSGWIEVRSQVGVGTEFKVYFPCAPVAVARTHRKPHAPCISNGNETILIVEGQEQLRGLTGHILKWHGYQVIQAENAQQALTIWQDKGDSIDLVLTDLVLPGGSSGPELVEKLRRSRRGLKAVYTSGYNPARAGQDPAVCAGPHFVPKPYSPDRLVQAIQDCLVSRL
jgi:two-component system cell cycle sensor histidine kinase/response regulator CckA